LLIVQKVEVFSFTMTKGRWRRSWWVDWVNHHLPLSSINFYLLFLCQVMSYFDEACWQWYDGKRLQNYLTDFEYICINSAIKGSTTPRRYVSREALFIVTESKSETENSTLKWTGIARKQSMQIIPQCTRNTVE